MSKQDKEHKRIALDIALQKPFDKPLAAYIFDKSGSHVLSVDIEKDKIEFDGDEKLLRTSQIFVGPRIDNKSPSLKTMKRAGAYAISMSDGAYGPLRDTLRIPDSVIDRWRLCFCKVEGRVVRPVGITGNTVDRPVCGARVHICEVDRWPWIIAKLPDRDLFRLRDDLLRELLEPTLPPLPEPEPPFPPFTPVPPIPPIPPIPPVANDPRGLLRFDSGSLKRSLKAATEKSVPLPMMLQSDADQASYAKHAAGDNSIRYLTTSSPTQLRKSLLLHTDLLQLHLCRWPWLWGWFQCDEITVVETDAFGRFDAWILHSCDDQPDLYFWVEYPIGGVYQTVHRPYIGCATHWNYVCGTDITIRVTDPRVPSCGGEPDLDGLVVAVMSIGHGVSLSEVQHNGLTTSGEPFGGKIEPRVWFGRSALLAAGISHYRWSYRRLTGPDGVSADVGPWIAITRDVVRHYSALDDDGMPVFPVYALGPDADHKFAIQPPDPPNPGIDWETMDEREDLASAHFETNALPHGLAASATEAEKTAARAGLYELKLELLRADNTVVNWTDAGVRLAIANEAAPFGTETPTTILAPAFNRLLDGSGDLLGFRMVMRVDNNRCTANILPITGVGLGVDPDCGFIEYSPGATATLSFEARHPWGFATFSHGVVRGNNTAIAQANASGTAGAPIAVSTDGNYTEGPDFIYSKNIPVNTLLTVNATTPCAQAAFAQSLGVYSTATDGYGRLYYDASDLAAFALATPCDCGPPGHEPGQGNPHN